VAQNAFDLVGLLDLDADTDRVHRGLYEYPLIFVSRYRQRVQQHFLGAPCDTREEGLIIRKRGNDGRRAPNLDLWFVVTLDDLGKG